MNWHLRISNLFFLFIFTFGLICIPVHSVEAQEEPNNPVYIVQQGDSLGTIAARFGIPTEDLISVNNINNPNEIFIGMQLIIPGLDGISGILNTVNIQLGEDLDYLSMFYDIPDPILIRLNRITSPMEIYSNSNLIIPQQDKIPTSLEPLGFSGTIRSTMEIALLSDSNPWLIIEGNSLKGSSHIFLDDDFYLSKETDNQKLKPDIISPIIRTVEFSPTPLVQGSTAIIRVTTKSPIQLQGSLSGLTLNFFLESDNQYVAYQGIFGNANPGLTELVVFGNLHDITFYQFDQMIPVVEGSFGSEALIVDPSTIDPVVINSENEKIISIIGRANPLSTIIKPFQCPMEKPICIKSWFGSRRSFNDGVYNDFHGGLDFGLCATVNTLNTYATAPGTVVYTGQLDIRGNTIFIDHGWGIYSGYYHLSEIDVKVGDRVEAGQMIGLIGATGRVTGPHLHFDIWVNGVQVDPFEWLDNSCE